MTRSIPSRYGVAAAALLLVVAVAGLRLAAGAPSAVPARQAAAIASPATQPETPERAARMQWFREARFGLFIHWGLYAIPAGEWKGQLVAGIGEWIMNRAKIPVKEYEQLAAQFNPVKFNADAWVQLAIDAGMKYIVITSKHHDGFALYRSKVSPYNIVDATPFKRDVLAELAAACRKRGIRLGFYYSQAQDWHEPNGAGNTWDFGADDQKDFDQYLRGKAEPQVRELLTGYGPVSLIWFDTPRMMNVGDRAKRFIDLLRELQPQCLIDGRLGTQGDYRSMGDNRIPQTVVTEDWEVPATLNKTWGFKKDDTDWKPPSDLVFKLVDIVSKGGNYLLNVGPTAEGVIPQASQDNLRAVGRWLKVNGEAIYGAKATPFGDEFGGFSATEKDKDGKPVFVAREEWRSTVKPGKLYIHFFKWPGTEFTLKGVKMGVQRAYLLADPTHRALPVKSAGDSVVVTLPAAPVGEYATVLCLETDTAGYARTPPPASAQVLLAQPAQPAQAPPPAPAPAAPPVLPSCPELAAAVQSAVRNDVRLRDWADLGRYRESNRATSAPAPGEARVVFTGDSITDSWQQPRFGGFFPGKPYLDRGISGQTTPQMLLRFRPDVIALAPRVVVILAGTNDIAGNTGPMTDEQIEGNLASMAELARAHDIKVVLSSIMPVSQSHVRPGDTAAPQTTRRPMARIKALNAWMKTYAAANGHVYLDYFSAMIDSDGLLKAELSEDDLHPNAAGYAIMAPLAEAAIQAALKR